MVLRTFGSSEPYQMHFDEVYHARTATEFLQDWRYGLPHDIYEWTHPHLAKYAMAVGLVLWGEDDVAATSELGVPVVASAVEPRRIEAERARDRAGERLHIATGTEIRTYDLRTRDLSRSSPRPGASAARDRRDRRAAGDRLRGRAHRDPGPRARSAMAGLDMVSSRPRWARSATRSRTCS